MKLEHFVSIDQNSHPLWDTLPKLEALTVRRIRGTHCIEDIDTAFTKRGATVGDKQLQIVRERTYRGGVSDWGATLFYTDFLGRNPVDIRILEPFTGMTTKALARALDCSVDDLYDRYALSDNWQLVGSSYFQDTDHHRVIGDLSLRETLPYITQIMQHARQNMNTTFPDPAARQRIKAWFDDEHQVMERLVQQCQGSSLVQFYREWLGHHLSDRVTFSVTSGFLNTTSANALSLPRIFEQFLTDYDTMAGLYNKAVTTTDVGLNTLSTKQGELPFFLVWRRDNRMLRTAVSFHNGTVVSGDHEWGRSTPATLAENMKNAGVVCVAGKAIPLILQARMSSKGGPLVLPYKGSLYMPAVHAFETALRKAGLLNDEIAPICRVKFNFLDTLHKADTHIHLPEYLHEAFSGAVLPAATVAEEIPAAITDAHRTLDSLRNEDGRNNYLEDMNMPLHSEIEALEAQRRQVAKHPETRPQASALWDRIKVLRREQTEQFVGQVLDMYHTTQLDYWNSRGALMPWSIALGGMDFYRSMLEKAEIYEESPSDNDSPRNRKNRRVG